MDPIQYMHERISTMIDKAIKDFQRMASEDPFQIYQLFYVPAEPGKWGEFHVLSNSEQGRMERQRLLDQGKMTYPATGPLSPSDPPHVLFRKMEEATRKIPIVRPDSPNVFPTEEVRKFRYGLKGPNEDEIHWDSEGPQVRGAVAKLCGWETGKGELSATGKKIVRQDWDDLSPAARKILQKHGVVKGGRVEIRNESSEKSQYCCQCQQLFKYDPYYKKCVICGTRLKIVKPRADGIIDLTKVC